MADDKAAILDIVQKFMTSISSKRPPFTETYEHVLPDAWCVLSHPDEFWVARIGATITRIEGRVGKLLDSGAKEFRERVTEPGPEIWVHEDLGAVWAGYQVSVDGKEVSRGINLFGLHRTPDGWKISGIADTQVKPGTELEPVSTVAGPDLMGPIDSFLQCLTDHDWDKIPSSLLGEGGITNSRRGMGILQSSTWPELIEKLRSMMENSPPGMMQEVLYDVEARVCGSFAFVWAPFKININGQTVDKGVNIFTMFRKENGWVISGCQDTSMPTQ
ncbi:hypothetical protein CONLIGDRAFT_630348 [Coniochaeta ligniaria NRRL 30616]|uniref:Uncharacterized protein n=1 Tax=Coniochaeta ligniaria NRRL 30616 TaxID=1408157 RepID=A0A1J7IZX9_9PEZI|nr:hypothetical protein CONLIGDRAFT_630348 [Coniochaeta ligniaria NRRL 30616]